MNKGNIRKKSWNGDVSLASKLHVIMKRQHISQKEISERLGVSFQMINHIVWGLKKTPALRRRMAKELGFESWEDLINHKEVV